ncbi:MAG: hypothetical protein IT377_15670 [Polyangiaceae bacterium]|nr:hypothetical protein [Polyangiaceae bacterium]
MRAVAPLGLVLVLLAQVASADAGAPDAAPVEAGVASADAATAVAPAEAVELLAKTERIRAFIRGELDPALAPQALFDVPLGDAGAIALEASRLARLLRPDLPAHFAHRDQSFHSIAITCSVAS